jgi:hypothetical protein
MADREGVIFQLPPPTIMPKFAWEIDMSEDSEGTVVTAAAWGIPTTLIHTSGLDNATRRIRATVYFVRYNDIIEEHQRICSNYSSLDKAEWDQQREQYSKQESSSGRNDWCWQPIA